MFENTPYELYKGDCLEIMKQIPKKSVDLVLCDLPYGTTACAWDSVIDLHLLWHEYKRLISDGGLLVFTSAQPFTSELLESNKKWFKHEIIWEKEQGVNFLLAKVQPMKVHENILVFGKPSQDSKNDDGKYIELRNYFKDIFNQIGVSKKKIIEKIGQRADHCFRFDSPQWSPPTEQTYKDIENVFEVKLIPYEQIVKRFNKYNEEYNTSSTYNPQFETGKPYISGTGTSGDVTGNVVKTRTKNDGKRYPRSVVKFNRETGLHPTQKPVALLEYLIRTYSNEGMTVLDNTMGSGSTGVACMNTGRKFIGIELDDTYFEIAEKRIAESFANKGIENVNK